MKYYHGTKLVSENEIPKCKICGSDLICKKKYSTYSLVVACSNPNCVAHTPKGDKTKILMCFGEDALNEYLEKVRHRNRYCLEYWIDHGFSEEEALNEIKRLQSVNSKQVKNRGRCDRQTMEKKLGKNGADEFFKKKSRYNKEYWTSRGYTEEEAVANISALQSKYGNMQDPEKAKFNSHLCKEFWITRSGMTEEEAEKIISQRQKTFTKEKCIEKYGLDAGLKRWEERQQKWQESLHKSQNLHVGFSKISQNLFKDLLSHYQEQDKDYVFFGSKNHEYGLRENDKNYIYDFTDLNKRKMIEFQGDIYHGNPLLFEGTDRPNPFKQDKTCKDLWEFDEEKKKVAMKNGFDVLIIWEHDYRSNKEKITKEALKFLELC